MGALIRNRVTLILALVATLSLLLPSAALGASPFRYSVTASYCEYYGGAEGYGYLQFNTKVKEVGVSGANYFRTRTKLKMSRMGYTVTVSDTGWEYSRSFPNDADNWYRVSEARIDFDPFSLGYDHRFVTRLQVWSNKKGLLSEVTLKSPWC